MDVLGSQNFRKEAVEEIKRYGYINMENFFERYQEGEDFNFYKLSELGYNHFSARNINAYINNSHEGSYYGGSLGWE